MKKLSDNISYLESSDNPLSAEVVMIKRKKIKIFYDCGASDEAYKFITNCKDNKIVIYHIFMLIMLKMRLDLMFLFIVLNIH